MALNPQSFFRFAAEHYPLLYDIFRREGGINDAELYELIRRNRDESDPEPAHVAELLRKLGIIEPMPDATAVYEITRPVSDLMRFLLREQRLTSAVVIQAYLDDLDQSGKELEIVMNEGKTVLIELALRKAADTIDRLRQDSRNNREAVINDVIAVKSNREQKSARERFEKILYLWERYLLPLQDLIDVRKTMDATLDRLEKIFLSGMQRFELEGALHMGFLRTRARLHRLRYDMCVDFQESFQEVVPLYESWKQDSELVQGASRILEKVGKAGLRSLKLTEMLAIPGGRFQEGLFDDSEVEAYLCGIKGYVPQEAPYLPPSSEEDTPIYINPDDMFKQLLPVLPIDDVLGWLLKNYFDYPLCELIRTYGRIYNDNSLRVGFAREEREYCFRDTLLHAHPMLIEGIQ